MKLVLCRAASQSSVCAFRRNEKIGFSSPDKSGGFNGSTQHLLEVYSQESESLRFFSGVDLSAVPLCPVPTGCNRTGLFSSGSIVVIAHSCFRSSRAAKGFADHRSRLSHW